MTENNSLEILAGKDTVSNKSDSSSAGASLGFDFISDQINASANYSQGESNTEGTTYTNTTIDVGNKTAINIDGDVDILGGNINTAIIDMDVTGDLNIVSQQDKKEMSSENIGGGVGFSDGGLTGNTSYSQGNGDLNWVGEQSGIVVTDGGIIKVDGTTTNKGGIIASTDEVNKLELDTGKLVVENIYDNDTSETKGINASIDGNAGIQYGSKDMEQTNSGTLSNVSVTADGIALSQDDLEDRGINTDLENAQVITKDEEFESIDLNLQTQLLTEKGQEELKEELDEARENTKVIGQTTKTMFTGMKDDPKMGEAEKRKLKEVVTEVEKAVKKAEDLVIENFEDGNDLKEKIVEKYGNTFGVENVYIYDPSNPPLDKNGNPINANGVNVDGTIYLNQDFVNRGDMKEINRVIGEEAGEIKAIKGGMWNQTTQDGTPAVETIGRIIGQAVESESTNKINDAVIESEGVDWSKIGSVDGTDMIAIHGGNEATADRVDGPRIYYDENGMLEGVNKTELEFQYNKIFGAQIYSQDGVNEIVNYEHKEGDPIMVWGHSLGADSTLEAYGKGKTVKIEFQNDLNTSKKFKEVNELPKEKADELNIVMPRVEFVEKYLEEASKNANQINLYMLQGDNPPILTQMSDYGDRSYESLQKEIENGNIKVPDNVNIVKISQIKNIPNKGSTDDHGNAIDDGDIINEWIFKKYRKLKKRGDK